MYRLVRVGILVTLAACEIPVAGPPAVGAAAPSYAAARLDGDLVDLAELRGDVVLLNIWATWCPPCRDEMPRLEALHREMGPRGLRIVAVSVDAAGSDAEIRRFIAEAGITFTVLHDPAKGVSSVFRTMGVPETFLIDRKGTIRRHWRGGIHPGSAGVREPIRAALGPATAPRR